MNFFDKLKLALSVFTVESGEGQKTFTANQWKRGYDLVQSKDKGVSQAMKDSSVVYTCVTKIASNLPQAVLKFYRGEDELPPNDPIVRLFNKPNPMTNQFMFFENSTTFFALYGEVFWYLAPSVGQMAGTTNLPAELVVLNPTCMQEVTDDNGKLTGWLYKAGKQDLALDLDEVLHIKFPNPYNYYRGISPIDTIKADVDSDFLAANYGKQFFINGAAPSIVFTTPDEDESTAEQKKAFMKEWNALHQGVSRSHKAAILNAGNDIKKIGLTQDEMDFINSRHFSANRIMSAFSVPPPIAGDFTNANYSNIKTAKQTFWNETLQVYLRRYANMINSFIVENYDMGIKAKWDLTEVVELQKDAKEVSELVKNYASVGVPVNILAETYHLPFGDIEGLDTGYQNISMVPVGSDPFLDVDESGKQTENVTIKGKELIEKSVRSEFINLRTKSERLFKKELQKYWFNQRSKVLRKLLGNKQDEFASTGVILNRIDDIWEQENINLEARFEKVYEEITQDAGALAVKNIGQPDTDFITDPIIINQRLQVLATINDSTRKSIERIVEEGVNAGKSVQAIGKDIKGLYSHISKSRSLKIARTESGATINAQQLSTYKGKGVEKKRWVGGTRDSHSEVTGTTIGIDESFNVGGASLQYPGDINGPAKETINCTCSVVPVIEF